eukprot:Protomagalhaensia_sp_Gyna_25__5345@NODE_678_length_2852_cov_558_856737_g529_i0_p2_GENE_NODE_678_length_2852_cov_558_856737_g529_i0NODE_678_length_2852_cov_558_856737_g529_i0_p2_ORF_typecomplete_len132_score8_58Aa_trans/PF01490_18/0_006PgaD/PF13994_6/0_014PAP_PilO/PF06864_12/0_0477TM_GPCR_Srab/PF10292_9/0_068YwiC/PF14256_6/0_099Phage_holin_3_6/PF07332_11/0_12Aim19/PF10315_9/6Aim19/PF10315_9/96DUF1700/PF08006_11/0_43MerC/PF03203_14/2_7_NODE_678_length_2852_cov_558_856737_g529_i018602255
MGAGVCCAWCCLLYFIFALIFLTTFGVLCAQDSYLSFVKEDIRTKAAGPVFIALGIYGVLALVSVGYLLIHNRAAKRKPPASAFEASRVARKERSEREAALLHQPSPSRSMPQDGTNPQRGQSLLNDDDLD